MKHKTVTLDVDATVRVEEYEGCEDIYTIIGRDCSTFESLLGVCPFNPHLPCQVFIDEEGKINGQPVNVAATDFLRQWSVIYPQDHICGKIMFVGEPDSEGGATDVDPRMESLVRKFAHIYQPFRIS